MAYATTGATGPHRLADVKWSTTQQLSDDDHGDKGEYGRDGYDKDGKDGKDRGQEGRDRGEWGPDKGDWGKDGKDDHGKTREVACDDDALIDALELANRDHGGTLKLAENCTYELGVKDRKFGSALPEIKQDVTIKGNGSTIKRDAEDTFRIFRVRDGGDLTLKDLTIKGGNANEFKYPGGGGQPPAAAPAAAPAVAAPAAPAVAAPAAATTAAAVTPVADGMNGGKDDDKRVEGDGGALLVERGGSAYLDNVKLVDNNAEGDGGAVANYGRTWLKESKVVNNHAQGDGGGIFNEGILKVEETHVDDNTAGGNGGGIANGGGFSGEHGPAASAAPKGYDKKEKHHEAGIVEIFGSDHGKDGIKSSLSDNRAGKNGGGLFSSGGTVTVSFTAITGNTACENGGGVYAENTDLDLDKVHVAKNHADGNGGGVVVTGGKHWGYPNDKEHASATIADSKIVDNTANRFGGGIYNGEWLIKIEDGFLTREHDKDDNATLTIRDTEIKANTALNGGGIFNNKAKITLTKTHVTKNTATDSSKLHRVAGGVLNNEGRVKLDDKSLISNNDPTNCANTVEDCFN
ncbi:polymorphic outer membrane repeat protein [Micromonospora sp. M42]|nr:polymorphic outer membrane repeat protein [Micromonospora sp. M42]